MNASVKQFTITPDFRGALVRITTEHPTSGRTEADSLARAREMETLTIDAEMLPGQTCERLDGSEFLTNFSEGWCRVTSRYRITDAPMQFVSTEAAADATVEMMEKIGEAMGKMSERQIAAALEGKLRDINVVFEENKDGSVKVLDSCNRLGIDYCLCGGKGVRVPACEPCRNKSGYFSAPHPHMRTGPTCRCGRSDTHIATVDCAPVTLQQPMIGDANTAPGQCAICTRRVQEHGAMTYTSKGWACHKYCAHLVPIMPYPEGTYIPIADVLAHMNAATRALVLGEAPAPEIPPPDVTAAVRAEIKTVAEARASEKRLELWKLARKRIAHLAAWPSCLEHGRPLDILGVNGATGDVHLVCEPGCKPHLGFKLFAVPEHLKETDVHRCQIAPELGGTKK